MEASGMIKASLHLVDAMHDARSIATALSHELHGHQSGMAGDDDAGESFAAVYVSAAKVTLDMIGFSAYVLGQTAAGLMRTAREFMAAESKAIAEITGHQEDLTANMADPSDGCDRQFLGLGQELPEVAGDTAWYDQYLGRGQRFRGSTEKVRKTAGTWRHAGKLMDHVLVSAQMCGRTANAAHEGEAADAFDRYFKRSIGYEDPPAYAHADETLMGNLVAACLQLGTACDLYADHIHDAERKILTHEADPFGIDNPFDSPKFGGNGYDGGLLDAVTSDTHIRRLGDVAHALDSSQGRVKLPRPDQPRGPGIPFVPIPAPVPVPVPAMVLASVSRRGGGYAPVDPTIPWRPPVPPDPTVGSMPLGPGERQRFQTWLDSLQAAGFGNRRGVEDPDNAYQLRTAGYPERELPLPPAATGASGKGMMADGVRPADGYVVDAKYTRQEKCEKSFRTLDQVDKTLEKEWKVDDNGKRKWNPRIDKMYAGDAKEMDRYHAALNYPPNSQLNGLEVIANDKSSVPYWQTMMALHGVHGDARYVP
jgi:hypothetical protein